MSEKKPKKKKTAGDVILTVILIAAICIFCYAGYNLFHIYTEYKKGTDEYNHIAQMAVTERDPEEAAEPTAEGGLEAPMNIDFKSLKSVNDDVVGWIYVEAVPDINYPVVHGEDNETYLHHTYEKAFTKSAWAYEYQSTWLTFQFSQIHCLVDIIQIVFPYRHEV